TGALETLKHYHALRVPADYFEEAMGRLQEKYLNISLGAVIHPASNPARQAAQLQQVAAKRTQPVEKKELTAQEYFERGFNATDPDEETHFYTEAIRLKPDLPQAFTNRGTARQAKGDLDGARHDFDEARASKNDVKACGGFFTSTTS